MPHRPLPPAHVHRKSIAVALVRSLVILVVSLGIGVVGFHVTEGLPWIDCLLGASMILTGMGPTAPVATTAGKLFLSAYAVFSGVVFLGMVAVLYAPVFRRFLHQFRLDIED